MTEKLGKRLEPHVFKLPINKIRMGYYSDKYFVRTTEILKKDEHHPEVMYQLFVKKPAVVCGLDEAIAILKNCTGYYKNKGKAEKIYSQIKDLESQLNKKSHQGDIDAVKELSTKRIDLRYKLNSLWVNKWDDIEVRALYDGEKVEPKDILMTIKGDPYYFADLETIILGVTARATSTATSVKRVIEVANDKPMLFFSARFDHFWVQATDGYAAMKAGAFGVSTDANADYWGIKGLGTIPHSLIASYEGSTVDAALAFDEHMPSDVKRIVLVDWENNNIGTTIKVLKGFYEKFVGEYKEGESDLSEVIGDGKHKVWGVRFDTPSNLRDKSIKPIGEQSLGVCPQLVYKAKEIFKQHGLDDLKIVVSGGFDREKIKKFEQLDVPTDMYGVGSTLLKKKIDVTADVVWTNGKPCSKEGREMGNYSNLKYVE